MKRTHHIKVSDDTITLNPVKKCRITVTRNSGKVEIIVRHGTKRIRLLCDNDGIDVGKES